MDHTMVSDTHPTAARKPWYRDDELVNEAAR